MKNGEPIEIQYRSFGKDRAPLEPYAVPFAVTREEFDKHKKDDPEWLFEAKEGVLKLKLPKPAGTVPLDAKDMPRTVYRITIKDGALSAEEMESKDPPPKNSSSALGGLMRNGTFAFASFVSVAWLGIWLARRRPQSGEALENALR